jgi:hypothetical protein
VSLTTSQAHALASRHTRRPQEASAGGCGRGRAAGRLVRGASTRDEPASPAERAVPSLLSLLLAAHRVGQRVRERRAPIRPMPRPQRTPCRGGPRPRSAARGLATAVLAALAAAAAAAVASAAKGGEAACARARGSRREGGARRAPATRVSKPACVCVAPVTPCEPGQRAQPSHHAISHTSLGTLLKRTRRDREPRAPQSATPRGCCTWRAGNGDAGTRLAT